MKRQYSIGSDAGRSLRCEYMAGTASLSIEPFELSRLRGGSTAVVWILNVILVLCTRFEGANYADKVDGLSESRGADLIVEKPGAEDWG